MNQDVKLEESLKWKLGRMGPFKNPEMLAVARTLVGNLDRVWTNLFLIPWLVGKVALYQDAATKVELRATPEELQHPEFTKNAQAKIHEIANADEAKSYADDAIGFERDRIAFNTVNFLLAHYGQPQSDGSPSKLHLGFDALYGSTLIGAWTAIEIALEDLWVASIQLLDGKHTEDRTAERRIPDMVQTLRQELPVSGDKIKQLSAKRKTFRTLLGVRVAYSCWFHKESSEVDRALVSLDLDALALMRNLLVHCASVPDQTFLDQAKGIPGLQQWTNSPLDKVALDGENVRTLIDSSLKSISALIMAVDRWTNQKL